MRIRFLVIELSPPDNLVARTIVFWRLVPAKEPHARNPLRTTLAPVQSLNLFTDYFSDLFLQSAETCAVSIFKMRASTSAVPRARKALVASSSGFNAIFPDLFPISPLDRLRVPALEWVLLAPPSFAL